MNLKLSYFSLRVPFFSLLIRCGAVLYHYRFTDKWPQDWVEENSRCPNHICVFWQQNTRYDPVVLSFVCETQVYTCSHRVSSDWSCICSQDCFFALFCFTYGKFRHGKVMTCHPASTNISSLLRILISVQPIFIKYQNEHFPRPSSYSHDISDISEFIRRVTWTARTWQVFNEHLLCVSIPHWESTC